MGVAPTQVQRWRKRGMPASAEAGDIWRKNNTTRQPSPNRAGPQSAPPKPAPPLTPADPDEQAVVAMAERPEEIVIGEKSCEETLRALRSSRQYCQSRIAACHKRNDEAMARQWVQTLQSIAARQTSMEDRLRTILERDGRTMSVEVAEFTFRGVLADLRQKLLAAPAALAAQVNPNDPIHAQGILENWVRLLFKETNEHNHTAD